jgi:hypothetical protein
MAVYQHVLPGMQAEAAATFYGLLGGDGISWSDWITDNPGSDDSEASDETEEERP